MAYFDPNKNTELTTDALPCGLSAILAQKSPGQDNRNIVAYVSRALTDVEKHYSQTEREALAIVWAISIYMEVISLFSLIANRFS